MNDLTGGENTRDKLRDLYNRHADEVFRYAAYTLMNESDAMDVVQEVFLRAHKSWDSFRGEATAKTWLFRIARNYIHDIRRKQRTERKYTELIMDEADVQTRGDATDIEVQELLQQLPHRYRQIIILRAVEGFSVAETSRILRLSETNVRVTYHRAKKTLEEILQSEATEGTTGLKGGWAR